MTEAQERVAAYNAALERCLAGEGEVHAELAPFLHTDLVWTLPDSVSDMGSPTRISGREAMLDFLAAGVDGFYRRGSMVFDWTYFAGQGESVTALMTLSAVTLAGQPYRNDYVLLYQLRDGQLFRVNEMFDTAPLRALAAQAASQ